MKVLFLNAYFTPEITAFTHLEDDLIAELISGGHSIEIICPTPTRSVDKVVTKEYAHKKKESLFGGAVEVRRFVCPREGKNPIVRAFRYFWCNFMEYCIASKFENIDVVFSVSTPPTQGLLAAKVAKRLSKKYKRKVPFVFSLQDVFPDSLVTTGLTKKGSILWNVGAKIEKITYKGADKIIVISNSMAANIKNKGVFEDKISVVSNWVDITGVYPIEKDKNTLYNEFNIPKEKFTVVYAGNFGKAQGANVVLQSANLLKEEKDIQFVIFGGGSEFEKAKEQAKTMDNVIINPLLPANRVSEVYSLGDVSLVTCKKGVGNSGMPSKTWSIMACNTPIIASFDTDSELADIIKKAQAGFSVEPEDAKALADAILEAKNKKLTSQGREYVLKYASKDVCAKEYVNQMERLINI